MIDLTNTIDLFNNKDLNIYITKYNNFNKYINNVESISYSLISILDSKDLFITSLDQIYKISDLFFYDKKYDININDLPNNEIYPNKIYFNTNTSNLYFSLLKNNEVTFQTINLFKDYTKNINVNEINLGYYTDKNIDLFNLSFDININKLNFSSKNNLYSYNLIDFNEFTLNNYILENNQKVLRNIFSFKNDYSNINSNFININKNLGLINGTLYRPFFNQNDPNITSIDKFIAEHETMYSVIKSVTPYFIERNTKFISYYQFSNDIINSKDFDIYTNKSKKNILTNDVMDILTFLMLKIYYLETKIK